MDTAKQLFARINKTLSRANPPMTAADIAKEAGIPTTSLYTMLDKDWTNRAVDNVDAVRAAFDRLSAKFPKRERSKRNGRS